MSRQLVLDIGDRIPEGHVVRFQDGMHLESRFETQQASHLALGQHTRPIPLYREGFQRVARKVLSELSEGARDVVWKIECDLHLDLGVGRTWGD
jgi:hypothetical protein